MEIQREEHGRHGAFFIEEGGEWLAELSYVKRGEDTIVVDHTEVNEKLRGQDIGKKLVAAVVEYARENKFKLKPLCPFTRKVIDETPEFQDVLAE